MQVSTRINKALFAILHRLSDAGFHSGEQLACEFGLSRSSVFNLLNQAKSFGLELHAVPGRGYRLPGPIDLLDSSVIARHLDELSPCFIVQIHESLESTNKALMSAAMSGARDGTVMCAELQHAGKGRRGRQWHSVLGGSLVFSVLWRFESGLLSLGGLSLAAGLAVARAVNRHSRHKARLKWPNDVLVDYRKLAGILVEVQGDPYGDAFAVVGIGLNVRMNEAQRDGIDQAVIDLAEMGVMIKRNQLLSDCLRELHAVITTFRQSGFAALRTEWQALDAYAGRAVTLGLSENHSVSGVAAGIDEGGAFLLQDSRAGISAYNGGEISLRLDGRR